jgi:hypothetical protein
MRDICFSAHAVIAYGDLFVPAFLRAWQELATKECCASFDSMVFICYNIMERRGVAYW